MQSPALPGFCQVFCAIASTCNAVNSRLACISRLPSVALVPACVEVMHREGVVYRPLRGDRTLVETGVAWRTEDDSPAVLEMIRYLPKLR